MLHANFTALYFTEPELLPIEVHSLRNRDFRPLFCSCDLDLDPMTIADRMVWPPSLSRDRKWPRVTKCGWSTQGGICGVNQWRGSFNTWTWHVFSRNIPDVRKWTSCFKAFESYRLAYIKIDSGAGSKLGLVRRVSPSRSLSFPPLFPPLPFLFPSPRSLPPFPSLLPLTHPRPSPFLHLSLSLRSRTP